MEKTEIIKLRKENLKITQKEFANLLSVSTRTIMRWEKGLSTPFGASLETLKLLKTGLKDRRIHSLVRDAIEFGNINLISMFITSIGSIQEWVEPKKKKYLINDLIKVFKKYFNY